jgi:hypothetical protein
VVRKSAGIIVAFALACPSVAFARDPAAAEVLYRSAREAAKKGDWATACAQFAESQRLDPAPGTLLNLADCEEHRGLIAAAWIHYVEAEPLFKSGDTRAALARDRAAALDKKVPRVRIKLEAGASPDSKVFRDDVELGTASLGLPLPVEPGAHVVVVKLGNAEKRFPVVATAGAIVDVLVSPPVPEMPKSDAPAAPPPPPPPTEPPPAQKPDKPNDDFDTKTLGWLLVAGGAVAVGAGAVTGIMALGKADSVKSSCGPDYATCDPASVENAKSGKTLATVSTIAFIGGAVLGGAGVFFLLRAPSSSSSAALGVGPGNVVVRGSF